ncbi:ribonuclease P protein component [Schumannella soli]|uniref:Ribonuclease P protein component n=1 Tax=Schumannella soli TaxID=2590779 RepID=A0A506Y8I8_9MICO|nr:ribonuclease P protein component [Schumannella soli]TPW77810.1 ribonuclease P protein component [Schumannella soli]
MLARANRVITADEFRRAVRRGRRMSTPIAVYHRIELGDDHPARFGFIITRAVGTAVHRNKLRRRFRAIGRELVDEGARGGDVVVRALPGSAEQDWTTIRDDMRGALVGKLIRS